MDGDIFACVLHTIPIYIPAFPVVFVCINPIKPADVYYLETISFQQWTQPRTGREGSFIPLIRAMLKCKTILITKKPSVEYFLSYINIYFITWRYSKQINERRIVISKFWFILSKSVVICDILIHILLKVIVCDNIVRDIVCEPSILPLLCYLSVVIISCTLWIY